MISPAVATAGEAALLLPAALLVAIWLLAVREVRLAVAWIAAIALAGGLALAAKLLFHACGPVLTEHRVVTSPSGHAALTVAFYGSLAFLLGLGRPRAVRVQLGLAAVLLAVAVGISRVRTGAHTPAEVLVGYLTGLFGLGLFGFAARGGGPVAVPWRTALIGSAAAVLLFGGRHLDVEHGIGHTARQLAAEFDVCRKPTRAVAEGLPSGRS